jgi:hypothetical protein
MFSSIDEARILLAHWTMKIVGSPIRRSNQTPGPFRNRHIALVGLL